MKLIFTLLRKLNTTKLLAVVLISLTANFVNAQVCSSPNTTIYGLNANGVIYPINISTANVGTKVNTATGSPNQANGMGYNSVTGIFYYFNVNPGAGTQKFVCYNPLLNIYLTLASCPTTNTIHTGCVSFDGTGYYCTDIMGILYYYSIILNKWTTITSTIKDQSATNVSTIIQTQSSGDVAIDGFGNLWIVTSSSDNWALYKVTAPLPTTAVATVTATRLIAPTTATPNGQAFEGIAFNALGQLFLSTADDKLYELKNSSSSVLTTIGTFNVSGVGNDLTSCSYPLSVLPVNWVSFTASVNNKTVNVAWTVSQSIDNKGFNVERSFDGKTWETLAFIDDTAADFSGEQMYSFVDRDPAPGNNYYRINQVDYSNANSYSDIKVAVLSSSDKISIWPNPAKDVVYVQNNETEGGSKMQIFDLFGKMIASNTLHSGNNSINVSNLSAGAYIVHISKANGETENQKIVKQ
jgi:hypothetical protein